MPAPWRATFIEPHCRAALRHALAVAAVMAGERALRAVQDERDVAVRAHPRVPARAAVDEVRPAAAVEQHDRLRRVDERVARVGVQRARRLAHVDDLHRRQRLAVDARGQAHAAQRVDGLRARGRAAGEQQRAGLPRAPRGDVARVVARVALVLVGGVVLLVEDDEAEPLDRREDGRARADADARRAAAQARPLVVALAGGELGVQDRDGVAEAVGEAADDLRRQADLRHEHDDAGPRSSAVAAARR